MGRFTSQDSFLGQIDDPPSLHRYTYVANRPTLFVDLTGHDFLDIDWGTFGKEFGKGIAETAANVVTLGGYGGVKRGYQEGRVTTDFTSAGRAYAEGVFNTITFGGAEAGADAYAEGKTGLQSVGAGAKTTVTTALAVDEIKTVADPSKSGWERAEAASTATAKLAGLAAGGGAAGKQAARALRARSAARAAARAEVAAETAAGAETTLVPAEGVAAPEAAAPGSGLSRPTARQLAVHRRINERAALAQEKGPFFVDESGLTASINDLRALADARTARTLPGATSHSIGEAGELFGQTITRGQGTSGVRMFDSSGRLRVLDLEVPDRVNFELKNTARPQAATGFYVEQLLGDQRLMSSGDLTRSIHVGTGGFTKGAQTAAAGAGVELVDLRRFPDLTDFSHVTWFK